MSIKSMTPKLAQRIVNRVKTSDSLLSDVAKEFGVSTKTVYLLVRQSEQRGGRTNTLKSEINKLTQKLKQLILELKLTKH
ncbi:hypothetical protein Sps_05250 [Shewanella psychrophila]|uniref:Transposase n=1 Tax=Shewanella psychrophila TaxID=225848 RepID=A0A1S6HXT8_9GAMM|nr:transposase [Shewanella psychrophila]AQS40319.1 hypothetical protein Sps_05250 [Shewanella psychrophila]